MAATTMPRIGAALTIDVTDLDDDQRRTLEELVHHVLQRVLSPDEGDEVAGWTTTTLAAALDRLDRDGARVQAQTIREALQRGGYITRKRVYSIGRFPEDRSLRGFTRPVNRIVAAMRDSGEIPDHAVDLLTSSYQNGVSADGFQVDPALASLLYA